MFKVSQIYIENSRWIRATQRHGSRREIYGGRSRVERALNELAQETVYTTTKLSDNKSFSSSQET